MARRIYAFVLLCIIGQIVSQPVNLRISYTPISTPFTNPVGIDYHEPTNSIVMSANYPEGAPENFRRIEFDGTQYPFSTAFNQKDEIKIGTVRSGNPAGFVTGDLFTGNGVNGQIMRISQNGARVINPWCILPNSNSQGLMRGSLVIDETGIFEYKLIVVTDNGKVWKIASGDTQCGARSLLADAATHLEGVAILDNDPKWGGMRSSIIAGAENQGKLYAIYPDGNVASWEPGCAIEDLDIIKSGENFFGINFGLGLLLGVGWDQWTSVAGGILATSEFGGLFYLYWDVAANSPKCVAVQTATNSPVTPGQWEHVTFAPAGIREILPSGFSLCIKAILVGSNTVVANSVSTIRLSGSATAVSNYKWNVNNVWSTAMTTPPPESNTLLMFFTQDYQNTFTLTMVLDNRDSTGGSLSLQISTTNLGGTTPVVLQVQDDQIGFSPVGDFVDSYFWSNGAGTFTWAWGPSRTDGAVLGPLNFVNPSGPFSIQMSITSSTGINTWKFLTSRQSDGSYTSFTVPLSETLLLKRVSCTCGDNVVDAPLEDCDGGNCCDNECHFVAGGTLCRSSQGFCDLDDFCNGNSATCTNSFRSSSTLCNPSLGVCDPPEFCTGNQATCPTNALSPSTTLCRPVLQLCDAPEFCTGSSVDCPTNVPLPNNNTACDDGSNCTTTSVCIDGACVGVDRLCFGVCGDGVVATGEQCDYAAPGASCCTQYCTFAVNGTECRPSTSRCDPAEYCNGTSAACPTNDNTTCPICQDNCNNHGVCLQGSICNCTLGYTGPTCNESVCDVYSDCGGCSTNDGCGWCCYSSRCVKGDAQSSTLCSGAYAYHNCTCRDGCDRGTCTCGQCICDVGYGSSNCSFPIDCAGTILYPGATAKVIDICGVCGGNGTTCIGCDGVPNSGTQYDRCGECGGNGLSCYNRCNMDGCDSCLIYGERCFFCNNGDDSFCFDSGFDWPECGGSYVFSEDTCPSDWQNLSPIAKGLGGAAIAGIVIGAIVGVICIAAGGGGTLKYLQKQRGLTGVVGTNPMYKDDGLTGNNPLYEHPDADYELKKV